MKKTRAKIIIAYILVLPVAAGLSGCRLSPVLEQTIYTVEAPQVDRESQINDNNPEHAEEDEALFSQQDTEDAESNRDREQSEPEKGEGENGHPVADEQYDDTAVDDKEIDDAEPVETPEESSSPDEAEGSGNMAIRSGFAAAADGSLRQVVCANGATVDVPRVVGAVAATGQAASLVQMLGGAGALAASSADFTGNALAAKVFADEGFSTIQTLWDGSGVGAMSDGSFAALLELAPSVCFITSGNVTFSDAQLAQLAERNIACVTLPKLNTSANIKSAVTIVGAVLGDCTALGGTDAPALADAYCAWYDDIIAQVSKRVKRFNYNDIDFDHDRYADKSEAALRSETDSGYFSLFVSGWDSGATYKIYSDSYITLSGAGVAVAPSGYSTSPLSYYMSLAGVVNTAAAYPDQFKQRFWYVNPLASSTRIIEISGTGGVAVDDQLTSITTAAGLTSYLGESDFPAVIVASKAIKQSIENDAAARKLWTNYGQVSSADGKLHGWGFADEIGQFVSTTVRGDYQVYVNPSGAGSWTDGSAEGVLESMWVAKTYYAAFSEAELQTAIAAFYSKFYRHTLSSSELADILDGR